MSRISERACRAWYLWSATKAEHPAALFEEVIGFFDALAVPPAELRVTRSPAEVKRRKFTPRALLAAAADADTQRVIVMSSGDVPSVEVEVYLADHKGYEEFSQHRVFKVLVHAALDAATPGWTLLTAATRHYRVVHGADLLSPGRSAAVAEVNLISNASLPPALVKRIAFDAMHVRQAHETLRRLYPVTIIGPDIWAKLPPLPAVEPAPIVTDLGNCKVLTAWPELCDPRDPAFLRGTVALRSWLWPHTIQNPADHVDEDPYEYGQG